MIRPIETDDGCAAMAYPPCVPSVVRTIPACLRVAMICSRNLAGSRFRAARLASGIGTLAVVADEVDQRAEAVFGASREAHRLHPSAHLLAREWAIRRIQNMRTKASGPC